MGGGGGWWINPLVEVTVNIKEENSVSILSKNFFGLTSFTAKKTSKGIAKSPRPKSQQHPAICLEILDSVII